MRAASTPKAILTEDLDAFKNGVRLSIRRKRLQSSDQREAPVLLLVHGSSLSALPTFDLLVPGKTGYSMMDWFVSRRVDVWTVDHEGYGRSTVTESNSDIACGVQDLAVVTSLIAAETGRSKILIYGLSSGALRAAAFAATWPSRVERLALDGFVWTGEGSAVLAKRRANVDYYRTHARRPIDRDFIASIFTRDHEETTEADVIEACATAQLAYADSVPTGTYVDMTCNLPVVDPTRIPVPTAVFRGEHDGIAAMGDLIAFFGRLPSSDKQLSVIPGLAHCTPLGIERRRMWQAVKAFLLPEQM